jgi:hypothetical protein
MTTAKQVTNHEELAGAWCAMWNDEPGLARQLVSDDFRMWLGGSANGDALRGPGELEGFVARFRAQRGIRYQPRVLAADDDGTRFAYSWDAVLPDGTVLTGADAYTLRGALITGNWSLVGDHRSALEPGAAGPAVPAADLARACQAWTPLWNGQAASAAGLVSGDFRIWFAARASAADDLNGPGDLTGYVTRHRDRLPGLTFAKHRAPIIDSARQRAAFTWTAALPSAPHPVGGLDLFQFTGGQVGRAWSWTGQRPFTF